MTAVDLPLPVVVTRYQCPHCRRTRSKQAAAGEDGADPGTVLNAVLHALRIDPPTVEEEQAASPSRRLAGEAQPTEGEATS